jgi:hypothetical protein
MDGGVPTDLHQHLLPETLIAALARRTPAPRLRRDGRGLRLELAGEPPSAFDPADHDPAARAGSDGADRIVVSLSTALGIEALPADEAAPLLEAHNAGVLELGGPFALWAAATDPGALDALLHAGALGLALPADALERSAPLLDRLEARGAPLFVHPGPVAAAAERPAWWPAMTGYVAQMSAAWHWFAAAGRARHPRLRVVFAMLAGGAPLHAERLALRGGPAEAIHDPLVWFDTSSYGPQAIDAMLRMVGVDRLVHGSDRPVVDPRPHRFGTAVDRALTVTNPARVLP